MLNIQIVVYLCLKVKKETQIEAKHCQHEAKHEALEDQQWAQSGPKGGQGRGLGPHVINESPRTGFGDILGPFWEALEPFWVYLGVFFSKTVFS